MKNFSCFFGGGKTPCSTGFFGEQVSVGKHGFRPARRRRAKKHHENAPIAPSAYLKNTLIRTTYPCKQYSGSIKPTSPYEPDHPRSWNQRTLAATPGLFRQEHKWATEDKLRSLSGLHSSFFSRAMCRSGTKVLAATWAKSTTLRWTIELRNRLSSLIQDLLS